MASLKSISGMVEGSTFEACKIKGGGNPGIGMRLFVEEAISGQIETQRLLNEALEKNLDTMTLMGDVTLAMRKDQTLLMDVIEVALSDNESREKGK